ncbi:cation diffusion facilitator family transporter [Nonomuraea sp. NPDC048826]|uniref:cation diffusion facilitator family transporter n=1 Tax=Nonomuraea sp. NPDC048826 TaxID=3364347 RepID=UPI003721095E
MSGEPEHDHGHHGHGHGHGHGSRRRSRLRHLLAPHSHDSGDKVDAALESSSRGMRVLAISFAVLMATAAVQAVIVVLSGSVALLGDTLHNLADALTAVPLAIAFSVGRRAATRRFTYGYGRAEDLAGIVIVLLIAASAAVAGYEAVERLLDPRDIRAVGAVAAAGVVGFLGNEWVARYRIKVGREIGSAALVADGLHARTDGFTSLAVLLGAGGAALGYPIADPIVGLIITVAILFVLRDAAREIYHRLMDAVDPGLIDRAEQILREVPGVARVGSVRMRWIGHALHAEVEICVPHHLTVVAAHEVAVEAEHRLMHALPRLRAATVHTDPDGPSDTDHHATLSTHR